MTDRADYSQQDYVLYGTIPDISTAQEIEIPVPFTGEIIRYHVTLGGAISGADADVSLKANGTAVGNSTGTVPQSGSAAGDTVEVTPNRTLVRRGEYISLVTDGASTGTQEAQFAVVIRR